MAEAGEKNVKGAVIISGGFREIGNDELESEVIEIAEKHRIRVIGPRTPSGINPLLNWKRLKAPRSEPSRRTS